jgi:hypothetical protein
MRPFPDALKSICPVDGVSVGVHFVNIGGQHNEHRGEIFSAVRSNRVGQIGFLSDWRRMKLETIMVTVLSATEVRLIYLENYFPLPVSVDASYRQACIFYWMRQA